MSMQGNGFKRVNTPEFHATYLTPFRRQFGCQQTTPSRVLIMSLERGNRILRTSTYTRHLIQSKLSQFNSHVGIHEGHTHSSRSEP